MQAHRALKLMSEMQEKTGIKPLIEFQQRGLSY